MYSHCHEYGEKAFPNASLTHGCTWSFPLSFQLPKHFLLTLQILMQFMHLLAIAAVPLICHDHVQP